MSVSNQPAIIIASGSVEAAAEIRISRSCRDGARWRRSNRFFLQNLPRLRLVCEEACRELAVRRIVPRDAENVQDDAQTRSAGERSRNGRGAVRPSSAEAAAQKP